MDLAVRQASLTDDREEILDLLSRNFDTDQETRFNWRHLDHPAGPAWCWFVYDRRSQATVATAAVFPRHMWVDGKSVLCGQVGDFAVEAGYRSLGPAVLMQRATFAPVDSGAVAFCYDSPPHDRGMSTFVRLGMHPNCEVTRFALPLRSDEYLKKHFGERIWTKPATAIANLFLRTKRRRLAKHTGSELEIATFDERFGEEFSHLDRAVPTLGSVRAIRSPEYLNWHYRDNPCSEFQVLVARRAGELVGYLVFHEYNKRVSILDVFGVDLAITGLALFDALIDIARRQQSFSLEGCCTMESDWAHLFHAAGFQSREIAARVVAYECPANPSRTLHSASRWLFSGFELGV